MNISINILGREIPAYGLMIAAGILLANIIAVILIRKRKQDINDFIVVEAYALLGGFLGAKILYLIVSAGQIQWERIFELEYFSLVMRGGFVFYGGLIGGLLSVYLGGKLHKINVFAFMQDYIFLIPFIHCFGRIGCHMAGCCYGIPYEGFGAVVFTEEALAPAGVSLFPIQLTEAALLLVISGLILFLQVKCRWKYPVETYLGLYGIIRFSLEYLRYDAERGHVGIFSTSQWIGILMLVFSIVMAVWRSKNLSSDK